MRRCGSRTPGRRRTCARRSEKGREGQRGSEKVRGDGGVDLGGDWEEDRVGVEGQRGSEKGEVRGRLRTWVVIGRRIESAWKVPSPMPTRMGLVPM